MLHTLLIVCPLVFLAGFVDAIGGGGGLISLPAYLFAGLPVHTSIATNKLSSAMGTTVSTVRLCLSKKVNWLVALPAIAAALIGSPLGARIALLVDDQIFKYLMLVILPVTAFYVMRKKNFADEPEPLSQRRTMAIVTASSFFIGCYDGFYGPGTGTFLILVYTALAHMDILSAAATTKLVNLSSNVAALVTFLLYGKVDFAIGLIAGCFCIAGHYIGAGMVLKNGSRVVRPIIIVVIILLFLKIITGN